MNPNQPLSGSQAWRKGSENLKVIKTRLLDVAMGGATGKGHNSESAIFPGFIFHSVVRPGFLCSPAAHTYSSLWSAAKPVSHGFSFTLLSCLGRSLLRQIAPCPRQQPTSPPPFQHPFPSLSTTPVLCIFLQLPSARDSPLLT